MPGSLSAGALAGRLDREVRDFALLDIREAGEAERGHIPGATPFPRRLIEFRAAALLPGLGTSIVLYDGDDGRADRAAGTLERLGYRDVAALAGGFPAWVAGGQPVATGVNVPSKRFGEAVLEQDRVPSLSVDDLVALQVAGARILQWDVRTPAEYRRATVPGSSSCAGVEIVRGAAEAAAHDGPVVVHCAGRTRSIIAARTLNLLGATQAVALENGTMGWRLAGRSLVPGTCAAPALSGWGDTSRLVERLAEQEGVGSREARDVAAALGSRADRPVVIVDVRSEAEHAAGRIGGSIGCPGGQLIQCTDDVLLVPAVPVVLLDDGDGRAAMTGYWLRRMGFRDVAVLRGGMPGWREAGLPVLSGRQEEEPDMVVAAKSAVRAVEAAEIPGGPETLLLDVGTSRAYRAGHVPGAAWLPRGWLEARIGEIASPTHRIVVTALEDGQAALAAAALCRLGYDAVWLRGGNAAWAGAGGPLEPATAVPLDYPPDVVDPPYARGEAEMRRYLAWEIALTEPDRPPVR